MGGSEKLNDRCLPLHRLLKRQFDNADHSDVEVSEDGLAIGNILEFNSAFNMIIVSVVSVTSGIFIPE